MDIDTVCNKRVGVNIVLQFKENSRSNLPVEVVLGTIQYVCILFFVK